MGQDVEPRGTRTRLETARQAISDAKGRRERANGPAAEGWSIKARETSIESAERTIERETRIGENAAASLTRAGFPEKL